MVARGRLRFIDFKSKSAIFVFLGDFASIYQVFDIKCPTKRLRSTGCKAIFTFEHTLIVFARKNEFDFSIVTVNSEEVFFILWDVNGNIIRFFILGDLRTHFCCCVKGILCLGTGAGQLFGVPLFEGIYLFGKGILKFI